MKFTYPRQAAILFIPSFQNVTQKVGVFFQIEGGNYEECWVLSDQTGSVPVWEVGGSVSGYERISSLILLVGSATCTKMSPDPNKEGIS